MDYTEEVECIHKISDLLQTGLNKRALATMVDLLLQGLHPDALSDIIQDIKAIGNQTRKTQ